MIKHLEAKDVCKHIPKNTTKVNSPLSNRLVLTYTRHKLTSDEINTHVLNKQHLLVGNENIMQRNLK